MSRGISTRQARKLRSQVLHLKAWRQEIIDHRLARQIKDAKLRIANIQEQLTPAHRLRLQQSLAQWEAHLDSLEDDGVYAITKGTE